jgi:thioredoxin 1
MADKLVELSAQNFDDEVIKSDLPVLVDFWAAWCGPCRFIAPIVEELATKYEGKIKVGKLNVDDHGEIAGKYGIHSIPTLLLFNNGELVDRQIGAVPAQAIESMFAKVID